MSDQNVYRTLLSVVFRFCVNSNVNLDSNHIKPPKKNDIKVLEKMLKELNPRQEESLRLRFGIGMEQHTLKEAGEKMGMLGSGVGQHEKNALRRLALPKRAQKFLHLVINAELEKSVEVEKVEVIKLREKLEELKEERDKLAEFSEKLCRQIANVRNKLYWKQSFITSANKLIEMKNAFESALTESPKQSILSKNIFDELELSVRTSNCIKNCGIKTFGDLVQITEAEMLKINNFGHGNLKELKEELGKLDLYFGMTV